MENKLVSMTDFVLNQRMTIDEVNAASFQQIQNHIATYYDKVFAYATFLQQPLTLSMFVPVDDEGNILKGAPLSPATDEEWERWEKESTSFYEAKDKVLFEGWCVNKFLKSTNHKCIENNALKISIDLMSGWLYEEQGNGIGYKPVNTVADLILNNITLTKSALKQIYESKIH